MPYVTLDSGGKITGVYALPQPGNPSFATISTDDAAWVAYLAAQTLQAAVAALLTSGCAIVSTGTPSISATYALDPNTMDQIGALARDCASGLGFPLEASTFAYPDINSTPRMFTSAAIQDIYKALRDYIFEIELYSTGQAQSPPSQPVTIA